MSIITVMAAIALAALLVWTIGAPIARLGGALLAISSLLCIVSGDPIATRAPLLLGGVALWLAGHFLTAYKTRVWSSRLAENIVTRTPLRYLDPVRGYEHRHVRRIAAGSTPESTPRPDSAPGRRLRAVGAGTGRRHRSHRPGPACPPCGQTRPRPSGRTFTRCRVRQARRQDRGQHRRPQGSRCSRRAFGLAVRALTASSSGSLHPYTRSERVDRSCPH